MIKTKKLRSQTLIAVIGLFVLIGGYTLWKGFAASPFIAHEAEQGTLTNGATVINDTTANNGSAIAFKSGTDPNASKIYWGAYLDGNETYDHYYGPSGFWQDAPWGNTNNTWDKFEANTGKKVSILHYGQPAPWEQTTFYGSTADIITNRGAIPLISMNSGNASLSEIANGKYDDSIKVWANNVKAWGKPFLLRWNWEMNGTWFNWGNQAKQNPAQYVAMWRHVHDVVASQGATNVTWVWCPNVEFSGSTPLSQLYPGDQYVDWTCMDGYNMGTSASTWRSFGDVFKNTYATILGIAPTKPMMIAETGSRESGGSKANWITDALTAQLPQNFPKIKALVWFNWRIFEDNEWKDWPVESSATAQAAFRSGIASPYYTTNNYGTLPLLTKVKPLD